MLLITVYRLLVRCLIRQCYHNIFDPVLIHFVDGEVYAPDADMFSLGGYMSELMLFSSDGRYAYLTHEYSNEVIKYSYDPEEGKFTQMQSLSTIPEEYEGSNSTITLRLTSDDRHLFVTNSGDNSIAMP